LPAALRKVPPFPPVAARLLVLLSNPFVSMKDVADVVQSDPRLSARLLQCVNSAQFGFLAPVTYVGHTLSILGLERTRQLTTTLATAAYSQGAQRTDELRRCWEHTVATAILADQIAQGYGAFTESAYTAGVIHDIGRLGLLVAYSNEYNTLIRDAADKCLDLLDYERERFGVDHAAAGRMLAEQWGLPNDFLVVVGRHHDPCEGEELDLLRIVHVACRWADTLGFDVTRPLALLDQDMVLSELPAGVRNRLRFDPEQLRSLIADQVHSYDGAEVMPPLAPAGGEAQSDADTEPEPVAEAIQTYGSSSAVIYYAALLLIAAAVALLLWR
jgi:HD-like signal output (HDOD) protein